MRLLSWRRLFAAAAAPDEQRATKCANGCGCGAPVSGAGSRRWVTVGFLVQRHLFNLVE